MLEGRKQGLKAFSSLDAMSRLKARLHTVALRGSEATLNATGPFYLASTAPNAAVVPKNGRRHSVPSYPDQSCVTCCSLVAIRLLSFVAE